MNLSDKNYTPENNTGIYLQHVTITRRSIPLITELNLRITPGNVVGITGPSGCGKTTLLRCMSGLSKDYSGTIVTPHARSAIVFQEHRLLPWKNILDNVALPLLASSHHTGRKTQVPTKRILAHERARDWLHKVHLDDVAHLYPDQLSGGMKQRAAIARALINHPQLLFVDEPFSALDTHLANELTHMLAELIHNSSITTLWVSHNFDEITQVSTHHLHLNGTPGTWTYVHTQKENS